MKTILDSYDKKTKLVVFFSLIYFDLTCIFNSIKIHSKKSLLVGIMISFFVIFIFLTGFLYDCYRFLRCKHIIITIKKEMTLDSFVSKYYLHEEVYYHYYNSSKVVYRKRNCTYNSSIIKSHIAKVNRLRSPRLSKNKKLYVPVL